MAMVESTMLPLGTKAPSFRLLDTETGKHVSIDDVNDAKGYLVIFLCNHCPFVIHIRDVLAKRCKEWQQKGIAIFGISSNNIETHPADSPEKMKEEKAKVGYPFPYLYDETQEAARAYTAACTPDFFLFDAEKRLYYRGQFDSSRPKNDKPITGEDLDRAIQSLLAGEPAPKEQRP